MDASVASRLTNAFIATWPSFHSFRTGPWLICEGKGGGQRVSAARRIDRFSTQDIGLAETEMRKLKQTPIFVITSDDADLDTQLADCGYRIKDPVEILTAPCVDLTTHDPKSLDVIHAQDPMPILAEIWAQGGIGAERLAVMDRVTGPKTYLLGRFADRPVATAFVASHNGVAMLHALEVLPSVRRSGIGMKIMGSAASWAVGQGADVIGVAVTRANLPANRLYRKLTMETAQQYHYRVKHD